MIALLLALLVSIPGVHYKGTVGTGAVQWTPPSISRQTGASFPLTNFMESTASTTLTVPAGAGTFSTNGACLLVIAVAASNYSGAVYAPWTFSWVGGTPTGVGTITARASAVYGGNQGGAIIYTATASQAISGAQLQVTLNAGGADGLTAMGIDCLVNTNASPIGNISQKVGGGAAITLQATLSVTAGSWVYAAAHNEAFSAATPVTNTTEFFDQRGGTSNANSSHFGVNTTGTAGSIAVGWSVPGSDVWQNFAALEIKVNQ